MIEKFDAVPWANLIVLVVVIAGAIQCALGELDFEKFAAGAGALAVGLGLARAANDSTPTV